MNGNDAITVEAKLNWKYGNNGIQDYYEATHNGKRIALIKNYNETKWFAMHNDNEHVELLPLQANEIVNDLVLNVESYFKLN